MMASEGISTVPHMGSFQRALLGYRRPEVDAAIQARDMMVADLKQECAAKLEIESELHSLSAMVIEREREIRGLHEQLRAVSEQHERGLATLEALTARLLEIEAQARGQATRIRMKALREAVAVGRRAQELSEAEASGPREDAPSQEVFEGSVRMEVGPLGDYSQLVGLEDAIGRLGASDISIERFSEGRATLSVRLDEPIELLRELEEHSPFEFRVRRNGDEGLILDVDDESGSERAA